MGCDCELVARVVAAMVSRGVVSTVSGRISEIASSTSLIGVSLSLRGLFSILK